MNDLTSTTALRLCRMKPLNSLGKNASLFEKSSILSIKVDHVNTRQFEKLKITFVFWIHMNTHR